MLHGHSDDDRTGTTDRRLDTAAVIGRAVLIVTDRQAPTLPRVVSSSGPLRGSRSPRHHGDLDPRNLAARESWLCADRDGMER